MKTLSEVLCYENKLVLFRFVHNHNLSFEESQKIFYETKKFLWLKAYLIHNQEKFENADLRIVSSMRIIDLMWHNFILFTSDYRDFCKDYLKVFIEHRPNPPIPDNFKDNYPDRSSNFFTKSDLIYQVEIIREYLGEDTVKIWFGFFRQKYPITSLSK